MCHRSENHFGVSRALSDLCQRGCCIIASPFRNPTGQNCRSICFTYCALTLHCSYLTLISSYQSQSLAEQVPRQPQALLFNRESLRSRGRGTLFGILHRLITNWKRYVELFPDMLIKNMLINMHGVTAATHCDMVEAGDRLLWRSDSSSRSSAKLQFIWRGPGEWTSSRTGFLFTVPTQTRAQSDVCDYVITQWMLKKKTKQKMMPIQQWLIR